MKSPVSDLPLAFGGTLVVVSPGRPGELIGRIELHSVEGAVNQAERPWRRRGSPVPLPGAATATGPTCPQAQGSKLRCAR